MERWSMRTGASPGVIIATPTAGAILLLACQNRYGAPPGAPIWPADAGA
jgi:hypothetical protein